MAGDTATTWGETLTYKDTKVFVIGNMAIGCAGRSVSIEIFLKWLREGMPEPPPSHEKMDFTALMAHSDGRLEYWDEQFCPSLMGEPYAASGAGMGYALAAMDAGASAEQAVAIAIKRHTNSGGEVVSVRVPASF